TLTYTRREDCEVPLHHRRRGNECRIVRRILTNFGSLISAEEKQLVLDERTTDRAAILVPLQRISFRGEKVSRVELCIPNEFKHVAVKLIRSGSRGAAHLRARVNSLLCILRSGGHFEFLQRIRKRQRHAC